MGADKISDSRFSDACGCILSFLEVNLAQLAPQLVTQTFLIRLLHSLIIENDNDLYERLRLCHAVYLHGGHAFPSVHPQMYIGLIRACNHKLEKISSLAQITLIIVFFRFQTLDLWKTLHKHLHSSVTSDIIYRCITNLEQDSATELAQCC